MSGIPGADEALQPASFVYTEANLEVAQATIAKYPPGRQASAVIPLLDLAQRQYGWLPRAAIEYVADMLGMPAIRVYEVATFYTMFNLKPVGRYHVQVCTTTPCWLRGSDEVVGACRRELGIDFGELSPDGVFALSEVECLGACVNAPMIQINDDYYEDLDGPSTEKLLDALARGEKPVAGPVSGRQTSSPAGGLTSLKTPVSKSNSAQTANSTQGDD